MQGIEQEDITQALHSFDWYQALTLAERLPLSPSDASFIANQTDTQTRPFTRWLEVFGNDEERFRQRLTLEHLSPALLQALLNESSQELHARTHTFPSWLQLLVQAFSVDEEGKEKDSQKPLFRKGANGFLHIIDAAIRQARSRLRAGIRALCETHPQHCFEPKVVHTLLLSALLSRLFNALLRTMALELNVARLRGQLQGETSQKRLESFTSQLQQPEVALSLLAEYPVLARYLVTSIEQWLEQSLILLERLCNDWADLCLLFSPQQDPGLINGIDIGKGDMHQNGQSVTILSFTSGLRIVYKPRNLDVDQHFQRLLQWLNEQGSDPAFQTFRVLSRASYGWCEFIEAGSCQSQEQVRRFYERQGAYLALLHVLQATDFHFENIIAHGEHPMLVDLETLFHPHIERQLDTSLAQSSISDALAYSVMRIGLLPQRFHANQQFAGVELSGLGGEGDQVSSQVLQVENVNSDELHFVRKSGVTANAENRPTLQGSPVKMQSYVKEVRTGFTRMYRFLQAHTDTLLAGSGPLSYFSHDYVRVILRPTYIYSRLLQESIHPTMLRNALNRERLFDHLWLNMNMTTEIAPVIAAERADLHRGDVPFFVACTRSCDLRTSQGQTIPHFLQRSGWEEVRTCLQQLSEQDLQRQLWFIDASIATLTMGTEGEQWHQYPWHKEKHSVSGTQLRDAALAVAQRMEVLALQGETGISWAGLTLTHEKTWKILPANFDLYEGISGIVLFLAYSGHVANNEHYTQLARSGLATLRNQVKQLRSVFPAIGAFNGWGGILYLFTHLGALWQNSTLWDEAEEIVAELSPFIERDTSFDIVSGSAGCIGSLFALYQCRPSHLVLETALQCGEHLLKHAQPMAKGSSWQTIPDNLPPAGFAHGTAGISWALLKLFEMSRQERFRDAALAGINYERTLYSAEEKNWPFAGQIPSNASNDMAFQTAWCHRATGIGLARLDSLKQWHDEQSHHEIRAALETTLELGWGINHSLCHGSLGNSELLLQASLVYEEPSLHEDLQQVIAGILLSIHRHGYLCGIPQEIETPGLMLGLAGIGYQLLRLACPEKVPSLLVLAPPLQLHEEEHTR